MPYKRVNPETGEITTQYTLEEKYEYYKNKANSNSSVNSQGNKIGFTGRVALANKAIAINRRQGQNKKRYDYYTRQNTIGL